MLARAVADELGALTFLDLETDVVDRELARLHAHDVADSPRRSHGRQAPAASQVPAQGVRS